MFAAYCSAIATAAFYHGGAKAPAQTQAVV
jgi:hypothetical protein